MHAHHLNGVHAFVKTLKTNEGGEVEGQDVKNVSGEKVYNYLNKDSLELGAASTKIAVGKGNSATGSQSIAIGFGNKVTGANSGAFGDPNNITGTESYAVGNNNTIGVEDDIEEEEAYPSNN